MALASHVRINHHEQPSPTSRRTETSVGFFTWCAVLDPSLELLKLDVRVVSQIGQQQLATI